LKKINQKILDNFWKLLQSSENTIILSHKNPDGDAIGSSLGFLHFLKYINIKPNIIVPNNFPDFLKWLPSSDEILVYNTDKDKCIRLLEAADLIICLDFNNLTRLGKLGEVSSLKSLSSVVIDHHPNPDENFDIIISDVSAASTSELLYRLICDLDKKSFVNKDIATCFYTGIMTDTGAFSYDSTVSETFEIVSELLSLGINRKNIHDEVYNNFTEGRMRLFGYSLDKKLRVVKDYNTAYITLTKDDLTNFDHKSGDTEGFVNYPLSISGIVFSAIFIEYSNYIKVSFRSKANVPSNIFASKYFEGGGHKNAAGGQIKMAIEEVGEYFESLLPSFSNELGINE